ncbi:hypothetical protein K435DRAFT_801297 [Dendrothele bispora CBS 962.96]|uniref:Uncharacterized protein n=1 Tax=Dendrothele bispora (strain CBS 962.96) TaxID=1314807 RepID=A0A4S8LQG2_DENBC|nr:hypothetical protein K435DRAFT_801297 [Dendrothele bispora CBS 962.96]
MDQTAKYFSRYRRDSRLLKSWVAAVFLADVTCMAAMYAWVYFNTAKYFATTTIVSLVSSGITDIFLATALVMLLKPMVKDSFREDIKQKVKQVLHRAISTGTLTAVLKIVMLTLAVASSDSQSNVYFNGRPFEFLSPRQTKNEKHNILRESGRHIRMKISASRLKLTGYICIFTMQEKVTLLGARKDL